MKPIRSFLNYPGNKFRLLPQLFPLFPHDNISNFIDLFCGSAVVSLNFPGCETIMANDIDTHLIQLLSRISNQQYPEFKKHILDIAEQYRLSNTDKFGYAYYHANSSKGLASINRKAFNQMRFDYNYGDSSNDENLDLLYALIVFGYNNQMRFNRHGVFNNPVGKRDFNIRMQAKLRDFIHASQSKHIHFYNEDFSNFGFYGRNSFVYADPPYSLTTAVYNEATSWNEKNDQLLFEYLDGIDSLGGRFALSNVFTLKGKTNFSLIKWSSRYHTHHLNMSYSYSSYNTVRLGSTDEVLITNY